MGKFVTIWPGLVLALAAGCRASAPPCVAAPPPERPPAPVLPFVKPAVPVLPVEPLEVGTIRGLDRHNIKYRELSEAECQTLAGRNASAANVLDDQNRVPTSAARCPSPAEQLRRQVRALSVLELRNQAAAAALERYFQLADLEWRSAIVREVEPILDDLATKATQAQSAKVRYPLEPAEVERQRLGVVSQLEQAETGLQMLNIDLRRRTGLPPAPDRERLWPGPIPEIDASKPAHGEASVAAALADRPELKAWRTLQHGLTVETLPTARELLGIASAVPAGARPSGILGQCLAKLRARRAVPDPCAAAEVEVRKQQLSEMIASRERDIADEARVCVAALNGQTRRVALARERVAHWQDQLTLAEQQHQAGIPLAELKVAQTRLEVLKARADLVSEVMAWHQARVRLRAAMGWLVEDSH